MSDDENFLRRWSRRKQRTRDARMETAAGVPSAGRPEAGSTEGGIPAPPSVAEDEVIIPALPPIESIEAGSDISAFLAPGVPPSLTRAALRRAWSIDPEIRNFVGLSENAWDFNAAGGVPGFGLLGSEDVRRLASRLYDPEPDTTGREDIPPAPAGETPALAKSEPANPPLIPQEGVPTQEIAATQHEEAEENPRKNHTSRRHGSALPQ